MAIIINFAGASIVKPGAYSRVLVASGGAASAQLGIVALVGEADGGPSFADDTGLSAVTFTPDQYNAIQTKYVSGPLVDMALLALAPSNDPQISGGAQQLILIKTNDSMTASLTLASSYGTTSALNAGILGNNLSVEIDAMSSQRIITVADATSGTTVVSGLLGGDGALTIQATGVSVSVATMTITATTLSTTVTGAGSANLSIKLSQFATLAALANYIAAQPGYTCVVTPGQEVQPVSVLDQVSSVDIFTSAYTVNRDAADVQAFFVSTGLVSFVPSTGGVKGVPAVLAKTYLSGGARAGTSNAQIQAGFDALLKLRINFVVPLFSQDATADIPIQYTDSTSTYTISSIHSIARTHVTQASTVTGRMERQAYLGILTSFATAQTTASNLSSARVALHFQEVDVLDSLGNALVGQPHALAVINAGMKAAAVVGLPNTFKLVNINGFSAPDNDFDPTVDGDTAITSNLTFVEAAPGGGFRFVLDNSTYGQVLDAWIYNRPSVQYAADTAAFTIRLNMETFVGQRNSDVTPETIKNLLVSVFDALLASGITVADTASGGKGYLNLTVTIQGSIVNVNVSLVLVEGIEFILNTITVQQANFS